MKCPLVSDSPETDVIAQNTSLTISVAVDEDNDRLYWTEPTAGRIIRSHLNGASPQVLVESLPHPINIRLDSPTG